MFLRLLRNILPQDFCKNAYICQHTALKKSLCVTVFNKCQQNHKLAARHYGKRTSKQPKRKQHTHVESNFSSKSNLAMMGEITDNSIFVAYRSLITHFKISMNHNSSTSKWLRKWLITKRPKKILFYTLQHERQQTSSVTQWLPTKQTKKHFLFSFN